MKDIFDGEKNVFIPLAEKMRPSSLDDFYGQEEIVGKNSPIRKMIETDNISSMIFWGPPGVGKTTLAKIIAHQTNSSFHELSAVTSGVKDIKDLVMEADFNRLSGKKTINLDSYFKGTYNLEVSRLFSISSYQDKYIDLVGRLGHESIREQVSKIDKGHYILVDDDSVTGRTLKSVREKLPLDVIIDDTYILANKMNDEVFDVVDLRDFVIGASNSGLVVQLPNKEILRVPYVMPYVNLTTRASIEPSKEREFTIKIWEMNKEFYTQLNSNLKLKDADESFRRLMNYIGFDDETKIIDICEWHICKLQLSEEKLPKTEVFSNGKRI